MTSHIPNVAMYRNSRIAQVDLDLVPSAMDAEALYRQAGGNITSTSVFGHDLLTTSESKKAVRTEAFNERYNSFQSIYFEVVNGRPQLFCDALLFYISTTFRLSLSP